MSQNPFDALGGGGFDMNALLQQAQQMQQQLQDAQARLQDSVVDGTVAGGAVTVQVNGVGELVGVEIKAGGFDGSDPDDLADLGDLLARLLRGQAQRLRPGRGDVVALGPHGYGGVRLGDGKAGVREENHG